MHLITKNEKKALLLIQWNHIVTDVIRLGHGRVPNVTVLISGAISHAENAAKNREEIAILDFQGWGKDKDLWSEYSPLVNS